MAAELALLLVYVTGDRPPKQVGLARAAHRVVGGEKSAAESRAGTPVEAHGKLHVCGTRLCDQHGVPVQLRGMSSSGHPEDTDCLVDEVLDVLAEDWGSSVLRIATFTGKSGYADDPRGTVRAVNRLIDGATARGIYVIVDWHWVAAGDPGRGFRDASAFFGEIARRHRNKPNVLYEILNESYRSSWLTIRNYAERIVPVIRAHAPDSVVLVGNRGWSTLGESESASEKEVIANPVRASNIMYTYHFYASAHREKHLRTLDRASFKLPVFVSEWGTQSWDGYDNDFAMSRKYAELMARKKIGWTHWKINDGDDDSGIFKSGVCAQGGFADIRALKSSGAWIRKQVRGNR